MDRRERNSSTSEALLVAFQGFKAEIWTTLPGIVQSFDPVKMTVVVQPTIQALWRDPLGTQTWQTMPLCLDVPVIFPSGGGCTITFPITAGDECLIIFASRCIDSWWQSGGIGVQAELRMHDLSDGFCLPGPRSQPRVLSGVSTTAVQIRSDDGTAFIQLDAAAPHNVQVQTSGDVAVQAPNISLTGNVVITGDLAVSGILEAADLITPTVHSYNAHIHNSNVGHTTPPLP
jgi:hypothetical protein